MLLSEHNTIMSHTTPDAPKPSDVTTKERSIVSDDSEMIHIEVENSKVSTMETHSLLMMSNTDTTHMPVPIPVTGELLADLIWSRMERHLDAKGSRDSIKHTEALKEATQWKRLYHDLLDHVKGHKEKNLVP